MFSRLSPPLKMPLAFASLMLLLVAAYCVLFTREYSETDQGPSKEAKQNPFFAAQHYVQDKTHLTWRSHQALHQLQALGLSWQGQNLGPGDTLILINSYGSLSDEESDNLWAWVEQGGHLIYHLDNPHLDIERIPTDAILQNLGLELAEKPSKTERLTEDPDQQNLEQQKTTLEPLTAAPSNEPAAGPIYYPLKTAPNYKRPGNCYRSVQTASVLLPQHALPVQVDLGADRGVVYSDEMPSTLWQVSNPQRIFALATEVKQGRITLLNSLALWENASIDCGDNGYFLKTALGPGSRVAWFINLDAPNLWQRLWTLSPEAVLACILALLAWLWHANVRFGEVSTQKPTQRRVFLDHFKAWSNYLWRAPLMAAQIAAQRQDCVQRAARRVPGFARQSQEEQIKHLEYLTGLALPVIQQALFSPVEHHAQRVTDIVYALQQLRSHL